jgi:hypothetical protein
MLKLSPHAKLLPNYNFARKSTAISCSALITLITQTSSKRFSILISSRNCLLFAKNTLLLLFKKMKRWVVLGSARDGNFNFLLNLSFKDLKIYFWKFNLKLFSKKIQQRHVEAGTKPFHTTTRLCGISENAFRSLLLYSHGEPRHCHLTS